MTHFQNDSQTIVTAPLVHLDHEVDIRKQITQSLFAAAQVIAGIVLLALSTHLALQSEAYLEALNQRDLNQYHAFALLVCFSFFAGILLIAQQVRKYDVQEFDKLTVY